MTVEVDKGCYVVALIQAVDRQGWSLEAWEQEFIVSVTDRVFVEGRELTTKQLLRLEQIYRGISCK